MLTARKLLVGKLRDIEFGIRGLLRGFGLKVGMVSKGTYEAQIRELVLGHPMLECAFRWIVNTCCACGLGKG